MNFGTPALCHLGFVEMDFVHSQSDLTRNVERAGAFTRVTQRLRLVAKPSAETGEETAGGGRRSSLLACLLFSEILVS